MPVILFGMLLYSGLMSNLSFDSAWDRARRNHVETMQGDASATHVIIHTLHVSLLAHEGAVITWVPALAINFALVPAKYRLLFINFVQASSFFDLFFYPCVCKPVPFYTCPLN